MSLKTISHSLLFYFISALGISLSIKAMVGVSSFNALNTALSDVLHLKVGTITTILNLFFLSICWLMDMKRDKKHYLLMLVSLISFGEIINLFLYSLLSQITFTSYGLRLLIFTLGTAIGGFGTGQVLRLDLLKFPIESFCLLVSERSQRSFAFYRYSFDILCVGLSLLLTYLFSLSLFVREGTLISLFLLSGAIGWSKNLFASPETLVVPIPEDNCASERAADS
ncbi:YczE/YyaS/YitT family protein [Enterococcus olivae]